MFVRFHNFAEGGTYLRGLLVIKLPSIRLPNIRICAYNVQYTLHFKDLLLWIWNVILIDGINPLCMANNYSTKFCLGDFTIECWIYLRGCWSINCLQWNSQMYVFVHTWWKHLFCWRSKSNADCRIDLGYWP